MADTTCNMMQCKLQKDTIRAEYEILLKKYQAGIGAKRVGIGANRAGNPVALISKNDKLSFMWCWKTFDLKNHIASN